MTDTIRGPVINIVDGDTFDMRVTHVGKNNRYPYNNEERIRIANIDAPELMTPSGIRSKQILIKKLLYKEVCCYVQARDTFGRIVADVEVIR